MKKLVIGFVLGVIVCACMAAKISEVASGFFSPRGISAISLVTLDEINKLRVNAGLQGYTTNQMLNSISNKFETLEAFDNEKH